MSILNDNGRCICCDHAINCPIHISQVDMDYRTDNNTPCECSKAKDKVND